MMCMTTAPAYIMLIPVWKQPMRFMSQSLDKLYISISISIYIYIYIYIIYIYIYIYIDRYGYTSG